MTDRRDRPRRRRRPRRGRPLGRPHQRDLIPADATATAELVAREAGVFSGVEVFAAAFRLTDPRSSSSGSPRTATVRAPAPCSPRHGPARGMLTAERIGLNFVQRMSGIATLTARYVAEVARTGARIVDTRKTTPGLRSLERHAVRDGGGHNHRYSLSDAVMAKDNHLAVLTAGGQDLATALRAARERLPHTTHVEVEVDRLDQIEAVLAGGPTRSCSTTSRSTTCARASRTSPGAPRSRHPAA